MDDSAATVTNRAIKLAKRYHLRPLNMDLPYLVTAVLDFFEKLAAENERLRDIITEQELRLRAMARPH